MKLKTKKSPGLDGISIRLLKDASNIVAGPLVNIFNVSLQRAIFPNDWKLAKVTPIFKEGNKTDCENYRPISVISAVAKLFEKTGIPAAEFILEVEWHSCGTAVWLPSSTFY